MASMRFFQLLGPLAFLLSSFHAFAQITSLDQLPGEKLPLPKAVERALKSSSLTSGSKPFHAVLNIGAPMTPYAGQIEVWWVSSTESKTVIMSSSFSQTRIVNGAQVQETNTGDYYPRWLQNFADGLLNPIPPQLNPAALSGTVFLNPNVTQSCVSRNEKVNGITVDLTWGMLCFSGSEPRLLSVLTVNSNVTYSDWKKFGRQQIPRTLTTDVLDYKEISAHMTTLEELKNPDPATFAITNPTPPAQQIATAFVSTLKEESLLEKAPVIEWPTVREGKTDGYMIVYARTDRTGQVRETAKHNSDQPGLESFGMEQALKYKFHPLLLDGAPVQMEMPLVLHFTSKIADPLPILTDEQMRTHISGCEVAKAQAGQPPLRIRVSVNEAGKLTGETFLDANNIDAPRVQHPFHSFRSCNFSPLIVNGQPTYYHGDLLLP
jgi:hypothetical protein